MADIFFKTDDWVFSYRVAGVLIRDGKILLQKPENDTAYSLPGGHVAFGETNSEALKREFKEEMDLDITVGEMLWTMENFFPWGDSTCHQIGTFFRVDLSRELPDRFISHEPDLRLGYGDIWFTMFPIEDLDKITVYPTGLKELVKDIDGGIKHLIYKEQIL